MISGLYTAASGMVAVEARLATIANNIANITTPGFKRHEPVFLGFRSLFLKAAKPASLINMLNAPGGGVTMSQTFTDYSGGFLSTTGNALDIAIIGPGFVAIETANGERYTRSGRFAVNDTGLLVTLDGQTVQNVDGGGIQVEGGAVQIDTDGVVLVDGEERGRIRIVEFTEPHLLEREGSTVFRATAGALEGLSEASSTTIVPESLEGSNVQLPREITGMLLAVRAYAANQRVITAIDETMSRAIDRVGAPS